MFCSVFYALNANCCLYVVTLRPQTSIVVQLCSYVDNFDGFVVFLYCLCLDLDSSGAAVTEEVF